MCRTGVGAGSSAGADNKTVGLATKNGRMTKQEVEGYRLAIRGPLSHCSHASCHDDNVLQHSRQVQHVREPKDRGTLCVSWNEDGEPTYVAECTDLTCAQDFWPRGWYVTRG